MSGRHASIGFDDFLTEASARSSPLFCSRSSTRIWSTTVSPSTAAYLPSPMTIFAGEGTGRQKRTYPISNPRTFPVLKYGPGESGPASGREDAFQIRLVFEALSNRHPTLAPRVHIAPPQICPFPPLIIISLCQYYLAPKPTS